jgi:hypothetical protein
VGSARVKAPPATPAPPAPLHVGILFAGLAEKELPALKYLLLHLNTVQGLFQFEFVAGDGSGPRHPLLELLSRKQPSKREQAEGLMEAFVEEYGRILQGESGTYGVGGTHPRHFVVVSKARFTDQYYLTDKRLFTKGGTPASGVSVLALGDWERSLAPPSLTEFVLTLVYSSSLAFRSKAFEVHYGTRGCIGDFTPDLADARFQTLQGFACDGCRAALAGDGLAEPAVAQALAVLGKQWLGGVGDPASPAAIASKLGRHNLFVTTGLAPTPWERAKATLQEEGVRQILQTAAMIALASLLLWLGLKE